jgi:alkanesulfonate monooxygenase SsuD/methylene tetrahydromethanopterin reductase-like flavin-dependent oxidoreductase (luciferase family)
MDAADGEGRDSDRLDRAFYMSVNINRDRERAAAEADDFLMAYYGVRHWGERWGPWGSAEELAERMKAYVDAGTSHLILRFASWHQFEQLEQFVDEVLPLVRHAA